MSDQENAKLEHKDWHFLAAISPLFARFKICTEAMSSTNLSYLSRDDRMDPRAKFEWWSKASWERGAIVMAESKLRAVWAEFRPPPSAAVPTAARFSSIYMQDDIDED
ncbi:unnamed protein product [Umbelopsis vinacea]